MELNATPLTTTATREVSPTLLRNEIDQRIVKVRPMATPLDQISRLAGCRPCGSMIVDYYSVASKEISANLTATVTAVQTPADSDKGIVVEFVTDRNDIFQPSETIMFPSAMYSDTLTGQSGHVTGYVLSSDGGKIRACLFNFGKESRNGVFVASLAQGTPVVRMGRAAAELDVQTPQFEALPTKDSNYCQIFKMQVEQSTLQRIANKEVGWTFSDQEEIAIADMRLGMEKNFLFGKKLRLTHPDTHDEIFLTGGIWNQAGGQYEIFNTLNESTLIDLCRKAFTKNAGNHRKVFIAGSELMTRLAKLSVNKVLMGNQTFVKWGLEFREIITNFGRLYVIHSEIFDDCGHSADGMIIDPEYITKYAHIPFRTDRLDLRGAGIRNTDAIVVTECSCLVLRNPKAHMRVISSAS